MANNMIVLYQVKGKNKSQDLCLDNLYFTFGRGDDNDLQVKNHFISRYHATIFRIEEVGVKRDGFYLIDHSLNHTYYNPQKKEFSHKTKLGNSTHSTLFKSYVKTAQHKNEISVAKTLPIEKDNPQHIGRIPDYVPHKFKKKEDIHYLIEMINDREQVILLAACGCKVDNGGYIRMGPRKKPFVCQIFKA